MALFKPYKCTETQMKSLPVVDGQVIFTTDTNKIYMDDGGVRKAYTPEVPDSTKVFVSEDSDDPTAASGVWFVIDEK